jgi:hypothetical protein
MLAEAIETTLRVTAVLTSLGIRYVVGGSLASSLQGIPRATNDVDLVAAMQLEHALPFVERLGSSMGGRARRRQDPTAPDWNATT